MFKRFVIFASLLLMTSCASRPAGEFVSYYQKETHKPYDEVLAEPEVAITDNKELNAFSVKMNEMLKKIVNFAIEE